MFLIRGNFKNCLTHELLKFFVTIAVHCHHFTSFFPKQASKSCTENSYFANKIIFHVRNISDNWTKIQ